MKGLHACVQIEQPTEDEVKDWAWHSSVESVDDEVLRVIGEESISFVFTLHVPGCEVQEQCGIVPGGRGAGQSMGAAGGGRARLGGGRCVSRTPCPHASSLSEGYRAMHVQAACMPVV